MAAVERLTALHYSVDLFSCPLSRSEEEEVDQSDDWIIDQSEETSHYIIRTNGISTCWMLEMATRNMTVRLIILWVVDGNTES